MQRVNPENIAQFADQDLKLEAVFFFFFLYFNWKHFSRDNSSWVPFTHTWYKCWFLLCTGKWKSPDSAISSQT